MSINQNNTSPSETVVRIPISKLKDFADHPFSVKDDDAMPQTAESIRKYGVLLPAIARPLSISHLHCLRLYCPHKLGQRKCEGHLFNPNGHFCRSVKHTEAFRHLHNEVISC